MEKPIETIMVAIGNMILGLAISLKRVFINTFYVDNTLTTFGIFVLTLIGIMFAFMVFKIILKIIRRRK